MSDSNEGDKTDPREIWLRGLNNRNIENIPHPAIEKTMELLYKIDSTDKNKIHFIHLNHTNKALRKDSEFYKDIYLKNFKISSEAMKFYL